jgi:glycosyltransferase involved in cell wall biosynthesis
MRIVIVTDTWNNINGVVTTLKATVKEMEARGHQLLVIEPSQFHTIGCPGYPEIKFAWNIWKTGRIISQFNPDCIHIATEGPLGLAARLYCKINNKPFNSSYHTKFPEYLNMHYNLPISVGYFWMRIFHKFSHRVLVTTESMKHELEARGFQNLIVWNRGVDNQLFSPVSRSNHIASKPVILCVSRASHEKGLDDFCSLQTSGTKILVGDGPYLAELKSKYPDVIYTGYKSGSSLAHYYANADVFVFPSKTDTFGVVMLESMACGTPVAAYPVTGPKDVIQPGANGYLDTDLHNAIDQCVSLDRTVVRATSELYSWKSCTDIFEQSLIKISSTNT